MELIAVASSPRASAVDGRARQRRGNGLRRATPLFVHLPFAALPLFTRLLALPLLLALLCFAPNTALAQTISSIAQATDVTREYEDPDRQQGATFYHISREDCIKDDTFTFALAISNPNPQYSFQIWVNSDGQDCNVLENRTGLQPHCWLVHQSSVEDTRTDIEIRVQDIAAHKLPTETGGGLSVGDINACNDAFETGIKLYFMHVSGGTVQGTGTTWETKLDMQGPQPPTEVEAGIGDQRLVVDWTLRASTSDDARGFRVYCVESGSSLDEVAARYAQVKAAQGLAGGGAGGTAGAAGNSNVAGASAGSGGDATAQGGSGTTTPTPSGTGGSGIVATCDAPGLVAGQLPDPRVRVCGEVSSNQSESAIAKNLENSVQYAVAVAAVDDLGNPGPLSNTSCEIPENLENFFEAYRQSGGQGGGGFCALTLRKANSSGLWLLAAAVLLGARRRRS